MRRLWSVALWLSFFTVGYNLLEGLVSIFFGISDETLTLLGFGVDSFVEVLSGVGIAHMVLRMRNNEADSNRDDFEKRALKITGFSFYALTVGLTLGAALNLYLGVKPETTFVGIIVAVLSILIMWALYFSKLRVGESLNSPAIIADAKCTRTCLQLSFILLASSALFELFQIGYIETVGSLGIAYFAFKEGRESFEKANSDKPGCGDHCC